jgi:hypothetical protein
VAERDETNPTDQHVAQRLESLLQMFECASTMSDLLKNLSAEQVGDLLTASFSLLENLSQPDAAEPKG